MANGPCLRIGLLEVFPTWEELEETTQAGPTSGTDSQEEDD